VRFGLQYLGWRSTSLGLDELTPGSCGNAFGVKKDNFDAQMETFDSRASIGAECKKMWVMISQDGQDGQDGQATVSPCHA
jgi:hypothetical protein